MIKFLDCNRPSTFPNGTSVYYLYQQACQAGKECDHFFASAGSEVASFFCNQLMNNVLGYQSDDGLTWNASGSIRKLNVPAIKHQYFLCGSSAPENSINVSNIAAAKELFLDNTRIIIDDDEAQCEWVNNEDETVNAIVYMICVLLGVVALCHIGCSIHSNWDECKDHAREKYQSFWGLKGENKRQKESDTLKSDDKPFIKTDYGTNMSRE